MKQRCYDTKHTYYLHYGGRGIKVCDEWKDDFMCFYTWAINNGYNDTLTLDRVDNDGDYEPNNCQWSTMRKQSNNRRSNVYITYNKTTHTMAEWARIKGMSRNVLWDRLHSGWSIEKALTTPVRRKKN